jgi:hypothetical protein
MSLENIHAGDTLVHYDSHGRRSPMQVERETPTQIITADGARYRKATGRKVGKQRWDHSGVRIPRCGEIEEISNEWKKRRLVNKLINVVTRHYLESLTLAQLETLQQLLEEFQNEGTNQG